MKSSIVLTLVLSSIFGFALTAQAQQPGDMASAQSGHVAVSAADIKWGAAPSTLPKGAQAAILEGNPAASGPFTLRLKFPANYKIPPHWHPAIEHVTVLSGTLNVGMGDKWDETKGKALSAGSFAVMPPKMHHFAWTSQETVIQLHGTGPWGITYLNSADDPSKK